MNKKYLITFVIILLVLLVGTYFFIQSRKTKTKTQNNQSSSQTNEAVLLTAKEAYNQLVSEARKWQTDAVAYKLEAGNNRRDAKVDFTDDGKSSSWKFWFLSPSQKEIRVYYFSNNEPHYYPEAKGGSMTYQAPDWTFDWQIDSNKAFEIAQKEGIDKPLLVHMYSKDASFVTIPREVEKASIPCKVWWDIWGKDQTGTTHTIYIDASSGNVLGK